MSGFKRDINRPTGSLRPRRSLLIKHGLTIAGWSSWILSGVLLVSTPDKLPVVIVIALAVIVFVLAALSALALAVIYRKVFATWPGLIGLAVAFGLISANSGKMPGTFSGITTLLQLSLPFAYLGAVSAFIYKRDISVALFGALLLIGVWMAAVSVVRYGGPANFLIAYLKSAEIGSFWWFNTLVTAFWCAMPPMAIGFVLHLSRLVVLEWRRG